MNKIFVIGNGISEGAMATGHLFGGLMAGSGNLEAINYGMDWGGDFKKINLEGAIGKVKTRDLILVPISEASAARCEHILRNLDELDQDRRWPFEFQSFPDIYSFDLQPEFEPYESEEPAFPERKKAEANCVTFFNWVARASGIDLGPLHEKWRYATRGGHVNKMCDQIFEDYMGLSEVQSAPFEHIIFNLEMSGGYEARMIRLMREDNFVPAHDLAAVATRNMGGYDGLTSYMNTLQPFEMEPEPLDPYLEAEFAALER